jgi:acyl-coenzyme A thioesterase PaaI-like protein
MFQTQSPVPKLSLRFDGEGAIEGVFACDERQQGYDDMVHGGVIAAVIDASMAQCLMGRGIAGVTTKLSITYRKPVAIKRDARIRAWVTGVNAGVLYGVQCEITQGASRAVHAEGTFYKVHQTS